MTIECMCVVCHGPIQRSLRAITCSNRCVNARAFTLKTRRDGYGWAAEQARMLHAWRREQMAVLMHLQALLPTEVLAS